jgi:hypothetical protein
VLNNSQVSSKDLAVLGELSELSELMLAGIGIEPDSLAAVLANKSLTRLDLSDAELSPAILDHLIADAEMLEFLVLQNCDVDHQKLSDFGREVPTAPIRFGWQYGIELAAVAVARVRAHC